MHVDNNLLAFKEEICDRSGEIDPEERYHWVDLSIGFFLGKGLTIDEAEELAVVARYEYHYWT